MQFAWFGFLLARFSRHERCQEDLVPTLCRIRQIPAGDRNPALADAWRLLQTRDPVNVVHQTQAYIDHLADIGRRPEILLIEDKDRIAGIVPVRQTDFVMSFSLWQRVLASLRLPSLMILGSEPMVVDNRRVLDELFCFLAERYRGVQILDMYSVRQDGPFWRYLTESETIRRRFGLYVVGGFRESFSLTLPSSVDDYLKRMSKKRRYNLKRQERLLEQHLGAPLELMPVRDEADLPRLLDSLAALGVPTGPGSRFTADQYQSAARNGVLCCFVLSSAGQVVGIATGICSQDAFFVHDLYFNKAMAKFSPGTTLWQVVIRHLIGQGTFSTVAISHGTPAYRFDEVNQIELKGRVVLYRRTVLNWLRFGAHRTFSQLVDLAKSLPARDLLRRARILSLGASSRADLSPHRS
jgi:CelD/BcsL family acetyltransferase involved in cellulose biosynthesis